MTRAVAIEHGCTSLLGLVILVLIASGTMTFGYVQMFRKPIGRVVMGLALLDAIGVVFWS